MATRQQGAWTNWEHASTRKITWTELWKSEPARLKFLIQSVYDVIPCHPTCIAAAEQKHQHIGGTRGSLQHILNCCPEALGEGRYRWRHDQVLKAVADTVRIRIQQSRHQPRQVRTSPSSGQGEKPLSQCKVPTGLLSSAHDWQRRKFPEHIANTALRPDIVVTSDCTRQNN